MARRSDPRALLALTGIWAMEKESTRSVPKSSPASCKLSDRETSEPSAVWLSFTTGSRHPTERQGCTAMDTSSRRSGIYSGTADSCSNVCRWPRSQKRRGYFFGMALQSATKDMQWPKTISATCTSRVVMWSRTTFTRLHGTVRPPIKDV